MCKGPDQVKSDRKRKSVRNCQKSPDNDILISVMNCTYDKTKKGRQVLYTHKTML